MKAILKDAKILENLTAKNGKHYVKAYADGRLYTIFTNTVYKAGETYDLSVDVFAKDMFLKETDK